MFKLYHYLCHVVWMLGFRIVCCLLCRYPGSQASIVPDPPYIFFPDEPVISPLVSLDVSKFSKFSGQLDFIKIFYIQYFLLLKQHKERLKKCKPCVFTRTAQNIKTKNAYQSQCSTQKITIPSSMINKLLQS